MWNDVKRFGKVNIYYNKLILILSYLILSLAGYFRRICLEHAQKPASPFAPAVRFTRPNCPPRIAYSLHGRRQQLSERLCHRLTRNTNNCSHQLLPWITNRLRSAKLFPLTFAKNNNSFFPYGLYSTLWITCMTFLKSELLYLGPILYYI